MNRINTNKQAAKLSCHFYFLLFSLSQLLHRIKKKITIQNKSISLKEAFCTNRTTNGYSIAYEQSNLDIEKKQFYLKNVAIDKAMTSTIEGNRICI